MGVYDLTLYVYNLTLLPMIFFSILFIILVLLNLFLDNKKKQYCNNVKYTPFVSVQIPIYNDPIALRCIKKCMEFDYPKDKYEIILVDDSSNVKTQKLLKDLAERNSGFLKYIHRDSREGFKAGALKNAMSITKGEIIVIFDSDWIPKKDFLKRIVKPFSNPKVAIVQTRQGFYNRQNNLITRFAAYLLMIYHTIIMPINNKINCVFFCGTAGAIRRKYFEEVGGWKLYSLTEDSDISVKLLMKGYKTIYIDMETPSEVPATLENFVKQQMRWCYGNARVFFDNSFKILFEGKLSLKQRFMIIFITLANISAPFVLLMTLFGFGGWFLGDPKLFEVQDIYTFFLRFVYTAGFLLMGFVTLYKQKLLKEFPYLILSGLTLGLVVAVANTIAFSRAIFNNHLGWYCTPKQHNTKIVRK
ncbi:MAG: glycosyltransferase [Candidatus Woesearchaeota archaeon]